jgi:mycofactocin precursor
MGVADPVEPLVATGTPVSWQARMGLSYDGTRPVVEEANVLAQDQEIEEAQALADDDVDDDVDELLVEEVSIDGMCGVY